MKKLTNLPRPSLRWLSIRDVWTVRNKITGLFLKPDQYVALPPMDDFLLKVGPVIRLYGSLTPRFEYLADGRIYKCYLVARTPDVMPVWQVTFCSDCVAKGDGPDWSPIETVPFKSVPMLAQMIDVFRIYFPFVPTDNYLVSDGKFVA